MAAKLTAAAARLQKAEKIVLLLLAMAAASGDLAFYPLKNVHIAGNNHRLLD